MPRRRVRASFLLPMKISSEFDSLSNRTCILDVPCNRISDVNEEWQRGVQSYKISGKDNAKSSSSTLCLCWSSRRSKRCSVFESVFRREEPEKIGDEFSPCADLWEIFWAWPEMIEFSKLLFQVKFVPLARPFTPARLTKRCVFRLGFSLILRRVSRPYNSLRSIDHDWFLSHAELGNDIWDVTLNNAYIV